MDMCHNTPLHSFKGKQPRPTYYLPPSNIYGSGIHDASNSICSVYTSTEFEGKNGMNNITYCLLSCLNDKRYYSKSYSNNHEMPKIPIIVENCGSQKKNNIMIHFLHMIKEGGLFGTATLHFFIKDYTKSYLDCEFKSLKVLYPK